MKTAWKGAGIFVEISWCKIVQKDIQFKALRNSNGASRWSNAAKFKTWI